MLKRRVADTIELDYLLRTARNLYIVASILSVPGALLAIPWLLDGVPKIVVHLFDSPVPDIALVVWDTILGIVAEFFAILMISQFLEASRRIRTLAEDPGAPVKPMFVPIFLRNV